MKSFLTNLSGSQRLLALIVLVTLLGILLSFWSGGLSYALVVSVTVLGILGISKLIWLPAGHGHTFIRILSLTLSFTLVSSILWGPLVEFICRQVVRPDLATKYSWLCELASSVPSR